MADSANQVEECRSEYDHLNEDSKITLSVDYDTLAKMVVAQNYGTVRFLAALVRARLARKPLQEGHHDRLAHGIWNLIKAGYR